MSQKYKNHYGSFSREILKEFLSEKELNLLDEKYTAAKLKRMICKVESKLALGSVGRGLKEALDEQMK